MTAITTPTAAETVRDDIVRAVLDLGDTPWRIARKLESLGLTGRANHRADTDVLAVWLRTILTPHGWGDAALSVSNWGLHVAQDGEKFEPYPWPAHVSDFVALFDLGEFPELVTDEEE